MGTNAITVTAGAWSPMAATTNPSVAARLYAGAVEATPTTVLEMSPRAPAFRPFSWRSVAGTSDGGAGEASVISGCSCLRRGPAIGPAGPLGRPGRTGDPDQ